MKKIIKKFGLLLLVGMLVAPVTLTGGCEGEVDDDGADLSVG